MSALPPSTHRPLPVSWLFVLGVVALGVGIWQRTGITGQDEYWLSLRTPLEMLERDSWWTPWLNGEPRLQKPPLLYWLICVGYSVFGIDVFAARIWGVLAGVGLALGAMRLHRLCFGRDGTLAGLLAVGAIGVAVETRRAMLDLPMACFTVLAVVSAIEWWRHRRLVFAVGTGVSLALAGLSKGPVTLLFAATAGLASWIAWRRGPAAPSDLPARPHRWGHAVVATLLFLVLVLPWPISMAQLWPQLGDVLAEQSEARLFQWIRFKSIGPVVGGGLALIAPWSVAVVMGLWSGRKLARDAGDRVRAGHRFAFWWVVLSALPFLFMMSFERYLIPMVAPMAVLAAHYLETCSERARRVQLVVAVAVLGVPTIVFAAFVMWFGLAWIAPLAALVLWGWCLREARAARSSTRVALGAALLVGLLLGVVYPSIGINELPSDLPADLRQRQVAIFDGSQPAMLSIEARRSVLSLRPDDAGRAALADFDGYVFLNAEQAADFAGFCAAERVDPEYRGEFRSFYSRKVWLRFARPGARWPEWQQALADRDLSSLKPEFLYYEIQHD